MPPLRQFILAHLPPFAQLKRCFFAPVLQTIHKGGGQVAQKLTVW
jgi:hypothetical protein